MKKQSICSFYFACVNFCVPRECPSVKSINSMWMDFPCFSWNADPFPLFEDTLSVICLNVGTSQPALSNFAACCLYCSTECRCDSLHPLMWPKYARICNCSFCPPLPKYPWFCDSLFTPEPLKSFRLSPPATASFIVHVFWRRCFVTDTEYVYPTYLRHLPYACEPNCLELLNSRLSSEI